MSATAAKAMVLADRWDKRTARVTEIWQQFQQNFGLVPKVRNHHVTTM
jgi:hypothetical protein